MDVITIQRKEIYFKMYLEYLQWVPISVHLTKYNHMVIKNNWKIYLRTYLWKITKLGIKMYKISKVFIIIISTFMKIKFFIF